MNLGIDKESIVKEILKDTGEIAYSSFSNDSYFYNDSLENKYGYNLKRAENLLDEAGWIQRPGSKYRSNEDGDTLEFSFYFVDGYDRRNVAEEIQAQLEVLGVKIIIDRQQQPSQDINGSNSWTLQELNRQIIAPRFFDLLLYGFETFVDPDRFELYHSSQVSPNQFNLSGYTGDERTIQRKDVLQEGESSIESVSKVDRLLEVGQGYDPIESRDERRDTYRDLQSLIAEDVPVIYLFRRNFTYYVSNNIERADLTNIYKLEQRFRNLENWEI